MTLMCHVINEMIICHIIMCHALTRCLRISSYFLIFFPFTNSLCTLFPFYVLILPFPLLCILTLFSIPINYFLYCIFISMSLTLGIPFNHLFMETTQLFLELWNIKEQKFRRNSNLRVNSAFQ